MTSRFSALCVALCELAGATPPGLQADDDGMTSFTIDIDGVSTSVMHQKELANTIVVISSLGRVPEFDDARACRVLMETNFLMIGEPLRPCISRSPITGDFVLHFTDRLDHLGAPELYRVILRIRDLSRRWSTSLAHIDSPQTHHDLLMMAIA